MTAFLPDASPSLVGRDREQDALRRHMATVLAGHGSLVLIGGEAGIGKTSLAEALCRDAARDGIRARQILPVIAGGDEGVVAGVEETGPSHTPPASRRD